MEKKQSFTSKISFRLLVLIFILITCISSIIGITSYYFAKQELIASGKLDLAHLTEAATEVLKELNTQVEQGTITREKAQEKARKILIGPAESDGNLLYDYSKSTFVYKDNGYLFAYDSDHHVTLHPVIPLNEDRTDFQNNSGQNVVKDLVSISQSSNYEDHFYTYSWINKEGEKEREKISYITYFEPWDWHIGIGAYTDEFYASLAKLKWITILLTSLAVVVGLATFYFTTKKKFILLSEVSKSSLQIADGDLTGKKLPNSNDEIGQLGTSFNQMTTNLRTLLLDVQKTSNLLVTSANELSAVSEETSASSDEIGNAMTEITAGAIGQATNLEETNRSLGLLTNSIEKMNAQNQHITEITAISEEATSKGQEIVSVLKKSNDESTQASEQISIGITNLYTKLKDISSITDAINNVSQQTNLLALNASIEAARAGEHGKGFAVVAEEVRKLAEESRVSTQQIQQMIMGIEKEVENTVTAMATTHTISNQLNSSVNDTEVEFNRIANTVQKIISEIQHLSVEIQQVTEQSTVIIDSIQNISAISEQTAASSEEITASVDEQIKAIHSVTTLAQGLTDLSEKVNETIRKYRL
ncbi:cache domain-containing protein [Viridibacillus sp. YIM B01967]|uniref:Cache domain-containing protein n=1 Tax=Viridibacillus soli TaxID=2798301 RepID=A0ABS1HC26_9BACL|nr:methyl-accepting chemotaxis protein [Viridibacillus soli]MBK3496533.1 cache domain-containing protein [Viridibacillus soli]